MFGPFILADALIGFCALMCFLSLAYVNQWICISRTVGRGILIVAIFAVIGANTFIHLREYF